MLVLITGSTGFLGREILSCLDKIGLNTRLIVRNKYSNVLSEFSNIEEIIETKDLFMESISWWEKACHGVDIVIHTAWYTKHANYMESEKNFDCLLGTLRLSKGACLSGVKKFIGIGTCVEYDLSYNYLSVLTPLKPTSTYGKLKVSTFYALSGLFQVNKIEFAWCRLFYLYGKGEKAQRLFPYIKESLKKGRIVELHNPNHVRDYLEINDAAEMITNIALGKKNGAINICSGIPITIQTFAENIADMYGKKHLIKPNVKNNNPSELDCEVGINEEDF